MTDIATNTQRILQLIETLEQPEHRVVIAIVGPPGSGKSTLAEAVVEQLNRGQAKAALLPMDGFHLDNDVLEARGLLFRKGAPETFDAQGLVDLVKQLRETRADLPYPTYDRSQECSVPNSGVLKADTRIVVIEGNYLLLDAPVWRNLVECFDASVFLKTSLDQLEQRLVERWLGFGHPPEQALKKAQGNDLINARLVLEQSLDADLTLINDANQPTA
ncbi:MAG: nucleoside triphosphate hydrolase [Saccharospirillum sp.]|nr:nucleoside triphosphate hydrolase [Saccharospirillum sp.]